MSIAVTPLLFNLGGGGGSESYAAKAAGILGPSSTARLATSIKICQDIVNVDDGGTSLEIWRSELHHPFRWGRQFLPFPEVGREVLLRSGRVAVWNQKVHIGKVSLRKT